MKRVCTLTLGTMALLVLGIVLVQASAPQGPWRVLYVWFRQDLWENMAWAEPIEFYVLSRGSFRKPA